MSEDQGNAGYELGAGPFPVPPEVFPDDLQSQQAPHQGGSLHAGGGGAASPVPGTPREELSAEANKTNPGGTAPAGAVASAADVAAQDAGGDSGEKPVSEMNKADLEAEAQRRGLEVEGSGADGNVTAEDLRKAVSEARSSGTE